MVFAYAQPVLRRKQKELVTVTTYIIIYLKTTTNFLGVAAGKGGEEERK
jgi:hypothetical protein